MKVRLVCSRTGVGKANDVVEYDQETAERHIAAGLCVPVVAAKREATKAPQPVDDTDDEDDDDPYSDPLDESETPAEKPARKPAPKPKRGSK